MLGSFPVHVAAREAGFYNTPPPDGYTVMSAPLLGSTWPERGVLRDSSRHDDVGAWNYFHPGAAVSSSGTVYMSQVLADYEPDQYSSPWMGGITTPRPLSMTLGVGPGQESSSYLTARWSTASGMREIRLSVTSDRNLAGQILIDGAATTVAYLSGANAGAYKHVTLRVERMPGSDLRFTLHTDTGKTATGVSDIGGATMRNEMWSHARVYAPAGCFINSPMISYTSEAPAATRFSRSFFYRADSPLQSMEVMPALDADTAGSIIQGQAEAECAAVWIDEDGRLQWLGRQQMLSQPVSRTLTSSELADAAITLDAQDVRRKVTVKYTQWATRTTKRSTIIVHEGSQDEYTDGDRVETIISTPSDEQWVQVDSRLSTIYGGEGATAFNAGEGSWHGYTVLTADGDEFSQSDYTFSTWGFEPIGPGAWKWTFRLISTPGSTNKVKTATRSEDASSLKVHYRGLGLPLLRAMGSATSTDATASSVAAGPSWAPELEHDVGWHIQSAEQAKHLADWVAAELKTPQPRITGLSVLPDPRIQLGDKIRVQETARTGLELVGIVTGITQSIAPGEHSMDLELMVLTVATPHVVFSDFDGWYDGMTVAQVDDVFADDTFAQHDAAPLRD